MEVTPGDGGAPGPVPHAPQVLEGKPSPVLNALFRNRVTPEDLDEDSVTVDRTALPAQGLVPPPRVPFPLLSSACRTSFLGDDDISDKIPCVSTVPAMYLIYLFIPHLIPKWNHTAYQKIQVTQRDVQNDRGVRGEASGTKAKAGGASVGEGTQMPCSLPVRKELPD